MRNTFYSQGNPYSIVRTTGTTYTASVGELIVADETEVTLPSGVDAGSVIAVRAASPSVSPDVVGANGSVDGFSAGTTHQEPKVGEYIYDGSNWYLRNEIEVRDNAIPDSGNLHAQYDAIEESASDGDNLTSITDHQSGFGSLSGSATYDSDGLNGKPAFIFDPANSDEFTSSSVDAPLSSPQTVYIVNRLDNASGSYNAVGFSRGVNDGSGAELGYRTRFDGSDKDSLKDANANGYAATYATDIGTPHIHCFVFDSNGDGVIERDDHSAQTFSGLSTGSYTDFGIGNDAQTDQQYWEGAIPAVYVYGASHGTTTRADVFSYLEGKYGF